jgi:excisionase family DNA binding protein
MTADAPDRDILNVEEAAQLLGVSVKTFSKVLHAESVPARKIGREWKFSRQALIEWVGSGRSDKFYKESASGADEDSGDRRRRTSGWKIELD